MFVSIEGILLNIANPLTPKFPLIPPNIDDAGLILKSIFKLYSGFGTNVTTYLSDDLYPLFSIVITLSPPPNISDKLMFTVFGVVLNVFSPFTKIDAFDIFDETLTTYVSLDRGVPGVLVSTTELPPPVDIAPPPPPPPPLTISCKMLSLKELLEPSPLSNNMSSIAFIY